jgi:hypothetical protein
MEQYITLALTNLYYMNAQMWFLEKNPEVYKKINGSSCSIKSNMA